MRRRVRGVEGVRAASTAMWEGATTARAPRRGAARLSGRWRRVRPSAAEERRVDARKQCGVRTATGQGEPDVADGDPHARADFQQSEPDRLTLGVRERGPDEREAPERVQ